MKKTVSIIRNCMLVFSVSLITIPAIAQDNEEKSYTVSFSKTVDGTTSTKEEIIKVKEGENIDDIVKKIEDDWTKNDLEKGKKINVSVKVTGKDEASTSARTINRDEERSVRERGKGRTIKKETKTIIIDEK